MLSRPSHRPVATYWGYLAFFAVLDHYQPRRQIPLCILTRPFLLMIHVAKVWPYQRCTFSPPPPADGYAGRPSSRLQRLSHQVCIACILHIFCQLFKSVRKILQSKESSIRVLHQVSARYLLTFHSCFCNSSKSVKGCF